MWILFAFGSALFAGLTAILARLGIEKTDSTLATAIRTIVVVVFAWIMAALSDTLNQIPAIDGKSWFFLIASGFATGGSWLCYFKALQKGPVAQVAAVDKFSSVLTIVLSFFLFQETFSAFSLFGIILIALGTWMMIDPKPDLKKMDLSGGSAWLLLALGAAVFASLSTLLAKAGVSHVSSNLATAIRTVVVLTMAWGMVFISKRQDGLRHISRKELGFICASGLATGASWLCYFQALHDGPVSVVVPIDKLSILVTILFSVFVLHEKISKASWFGVALLCGGTLLMIL